MKCVCFVLLCYWCVLECFAMSVSEIEEFSNYLKNSSDLEQQVESENKEDNRPISDRGWETSGKFEGDIILNERQRKMLLSNAVEGLARNGIIDVTKRWPNNELIYFINRAHFSSRQLQSIQNAINGLARLSCVNFRPYRRGDRGAVYIQGNRPGCYSEVGYQGGFQILNLDINRFDCFFRGIVMHEFLHALGFYHMQSSPDRDQYIYVLWDNIIEREKHNFRKLNSFFVTDYGLGYDYSSIMHYGPKAFSANGKDTIVAKNGAAIGQIIALSEKDVMKLNIMYCEANDDLYYRR